MNLRLVLLLRGATSLLFVAYLLIAPVSVEAQKGLGRSGYLALVDGVIGVVLSFAVYRHPPGRWLSPLVIADAILRILIGVVGFAAPGIQSRVIDSVIYNSAVVVFCIVLGGAGIVYVAMQGRQPLPGGLRSGALPAFIVSSATLIFGLAVAFGMSTEEGRRLIVGALTAVLGLTYLVTGLRLNREGLKQAQAVSK